MGSRIAVLWASLGLVLTASEAHAAFFELDTPGATAEINGGLFFAVQDGNVGTGTFDPFLSIRNNGTVQDNDPNTQEGFNTDARPTSFPDVDFNSMRTRAVRFSAFSQGTHRGIDYVQIALDTNEANDLPDSYLDMMKFQVYVHNDTSAAGALVNAFPFHESLQKVYDLDLGPDGDSTLRTNDNLTEGSGSGIDVIINIPTAAFTAANATANSYIYLYVAWANTMTNGQPGGFDGGFEEFQASTATIPFSPSVPEPSSILLCALGLGALGFWRVREVKRKSSAGARAATSTARVRD